MYKLGYVITDIADILTCQLYHIHNLSRHKQYWNLLQSICNRSSFYNIDFWYNLIYMFQCNISNVFCYNNCNLLFQYRLTLLLCVFKLLIHCVMLLFSVEGEEHLKDGRCSWSWIRWRSPVLNDCLRQEQPVLSRKQSSVYPLMHLWTHHI